MFIYIQIDAILVENLHRGIGNSTLDGSIKGGEDGVPFIRGELHYYDGELILVPEVCDASDQRTPVHRSGRGGDFVTLWDDECDPPSAFSPRRG